MESLKVLLTELGAYEATAFHTLLGLPATVHRAQCTPRVCHTFQTRMEKSRMDFYTLLDHVIDLLRQRQRVTYRALLRQFDLG